MPNNFSKSKYIFLMAVSADSIGHESDYVTHGVGTIYFLRKFSQTMGLLTISDNFCRVPESIFYLEVKFIERIYFLRFWWYNSF